MLVYRRVHVHEERQFRNCQQSRATGEKKMYAEQEIFPPQHISCVAT